MLETISLSEPAPHRACFLSKFSRRGVHCFTRFRIWFNIFIWNAKMQYGSLWGKCKIVFPFCLWFLKCVFKMYSEWFFYPVLLLWPCGSHDFQCTRFSAPWDVGMRSSGITARFLFHERNTASLTFLMVWILYHLRMFANIKLLHVFKWAFFILNFICLQIYFFNKSPKLSLSTY